MPSAQIAIRQSASGGVLTGAANVIAVIGAASLASANAVHTFDSDTGIEDEVGVGRGVELAAAIAREAKQRVVLVACENGVAGSIGSVTETPAGTGPTPVLAGPAKDDIDLAIRIPKGGAAGTGQFEVSLDDGATYGPTLEIPQKTAAAIIGTVDLNGITPSSLNTKTLIFNPDGSGNVTITFSGVATIADIITQVAAGTGFGAANVGGFLKVYSDTTGASSTLVVGSGTANADLGFTAAASATGVDSVYEIPNTGITVTFPATSDYVEGTVYTSTILAPRATTAQVVAAMEALRASGVKFGGIVLAQEEDTAASTRVMANAIKTKLASMFTLKKLCWAALGCPKDASDTSCKDEFATFTSPIGEVTVTAGDAFIPGHVYAGSKRRPLSWALAIRAAQARFSSDVGNGQDGPLDFISDWTRDEFEASVKLRDFRFTVLETRSGNKSQAFFSRGTTMALGSSRFTDLNLTRLILEIAKDAQAYFDLEINNDRVLKKDGTISPGEADALDKGMKKLLGKKYVNNPTGPAHCSSIGVEVDRTEVQSETDNLTATIDVLAKSQQKSVFVTIGYKTALSVTEA